MNNVRKFWVKLLTYGAIFITGCQLQSAENKNDESENAVIYGPMPCTSDKQCEEDNGKGWYCDKNNTIGTGNDAAIWPVCKEKSK